MQGLSSIIFTSAAFFKQPDAGDFLQVQNLYLSNAIMKINGFLLRKARCQENVPVTLFAPVSGGNFTFESEKA